MLVFDVKQPQGIFCDLTGQEDGPANLIVHRGETTDLGDILLGENVRKHSVQSRIECLNDWVRCCHRVWIRECAEYAGWDTGSFDV